MKKFVLSVFVLLAVIPLLTQCASQSDVNELRYQLRIVNKKLEDMKSATLPLQKNQAAASGQMDQLEREILELKGQLDETHYLNQKLKEQNKELESSISNVAQEEAVKREEALRRFEETLREKEAKLAEKLNQQQESVKAIQEARLKEAERKAKETALMAELAKKKTQTANAAATPAPTKAPKKVTTEKKPETPAAAPSPGTAEDSAATNKQASPAAEKEKPEVSSAATQEKASQAATPPGASGDQADSTMKKAQKLFEKNSYAEALPLFEQVAGNASSNESVDARFMMGECLYNQKEYDKAIMQYQKIISQYSGHDKAPSAMFKQGMAFEKLADKETAKVIYKKLLKKHGSSPEGSKAQERLGKL